jgi:NAD(P)-dependent dehydrogenase (short-subunit alcohol dehydrogenase family)
MSRTYVVAGAASGIGNETAELLSSRGAKVLGVHLKNADINVDLTTAAGRENLVAEAGRLGGGQIDGVLAIAGPAAPIPATVGVNFFGMAASLEGLGPLLAGSPAPRAVGTSGSPPWRA